MPRKIEKLEESVVNRIAAGEVSGLYVHCHVIIVTCIYMYMRAIFN